MCFSSHRYRGTNFSILYLIVNEKTLKVFTASTPIHTPTLTLAIEKPLRIKNTYFVQRR